MGKIIKNKITKRLILVNSIILSTSLIFFLFFTTATFSKQVFISKSEQLLEESSNFINFLNMNNNDEFFFHLKGKSSQCLHIIYSDGFPKEAVKIFQRDDSPREFVQGNEFQAELNKITDKPSKITISDQTYLAVSQSLNDFEIEMYNRTAFFNNRTYSSEIKLISLLPYEEITGVTTNNIIKVVTVYFIIMLISVLIIRYQSKKITNPILRLSEVAVEYGQRNFTNTIEINTGDETEILGKNMQSMVNNLLEYEQSQIGLFRNLSHELKTPLTAISGYAEGIENGYYNEETIKRPLKFIQDESMRIKNILEDLIYLSKLNSKIEEYHFNSFNIVNTLTESIEKIESIAILNDISIEYSPPSEILVLADEEKIMRVFINILSNALKFTENLIEVQVELDNKFISVTISDNGNGFDSNSLEKAFNKYSNDKIDGNGLGLMIVNEIISKHNGNVFATNSEKGAKVTISIPFSI